MNKKRGNTRGLSMVITTMILILLVLTSISIIWVVVQTAIEDNTELIEYQEQCLGIDLRITNLACNASNMCNISVTRRTGGGDFSGIKVVFANEDETETDVYNWVVALSELDSETESNINVVGITSIDKSKTKLVPYFLTLKDEEILCE